MKNLKLVLTGIFILFLSVETMAQSDPPDPPPEHGSDEDQLPAGAPLGGGLFVLLTAGLAYGGKKVYNLMKGNKAEPVA